MIKIDSTQISTVVKCTECPWWSGFAFDRTDGWKVGARHQSVFHEGSTQAATAARVRAHRGQ